MPFIVILVTFASALYFHLDYVIYACCILESMSILILLLYSLTNRVFLSPLDSGISLVSRIFLLGIVLTLGNNQIAALVIGISIAVLLFYFFTMIRKFKPESVST